MAIELWGFFGTSLVMEFKVLYMVLFKNNLGPCLGLLSILDVLCYSLGSDHEPLP